MKTMYIVSRQTTTNGTTTEVVGVKGEDIDEAILNAKIKAYELMKSFKNESTMIDAFVGVSDLMGNVFIISEFWEKKVSES